VPKSARPSTDRVREALFSILDSRISLEEAHVLDLFCGSGSLGIEALSRGARTAFFVDSNSDSIKAVRENLLSLEIADGQVLQSTVDKFLQNDAKKKNSDDTGRYSLVFADPPYADLELKSLLRALSGSGLLKAEAQLVVESQVEEKDSPSEIDQFRLLVDRSYGQSRIRLFEHSVADVEELNE